MKALLQTCIRNFYFQNAVVHICLRWISFAIFRTRLTIYLHPFGYLYNHSRIRDITCRILFTGKSTRLSFRWTFFKLPLHPTSTSVWHFTLTFPWWDKREPPQNGKIWFHWRLPELYYSDGLSLQHHPGPLHDSLKRMITFDFTLTVYTRENFHLLIHITWKNV